MNERIRELFQEAIDYADKTHTYTPEEGFNIQVWDKIRLEKFAQLIVRECVEHLESSVLVPNIEHSRTKTKCIRSIKEHFGVEE